MRKTYTNTSELTSLSAAESKQLVVLLSKVDIVDHVINTVYLKQSIHAISSFFTKNIRCQQLKG